MLNQSQLLIKVSKRFPASLFLEDVVNLLKRLFALSVAQDISSLEKYGSILLEFNRNGGKLPIAHKFCHEVAHVGKQGFENFWLLIFLDRLKNLCLIILPGWRLTRAGSRLGGRRAWTIVHTVLTLRLVHHHVERVSVLFGGTDRLEVGEFLRLHHLNTITFLVHEHPRLLTVNDLLMPLVLPVDFVVAHLRIQVCLVRVVQALTMRFFCPLFLL